MSGESGLVDKKTIAEFKDKYQQKLDEYNPSNIFNCDETGLFWRQDTKKTIVLNAEDKASGKVAKERITILFCVSMTGEKLPPLVIGK